MQQTCLQCSAPFEVTQADLAFYDKVSPIFAGKKEPIPPPTLCPACREQRRLAHRNERVLYRRTAEKTAGAFLISSYHPDLPYKVLPAAEWWGDTWDGSAEGRPFDPSRSFAEQFHELQLRTPRIAVLQSQNENSEYTNCVSNLKDCYLLSSSDYDRDCYYGTWIERSQNCVDNYILQRSEEVYGSVFSDQLHHCSDAIFSRNCHDCSFLFDCQGCSNCVLCWNLRNKEYCIGNEQLTKDAYQRMVASLRLDSWSGREEARRSFRAFLRERAIHPAMWRKGRVFDSSGDWLSDVEQCADCFALVSAKDCVRACDGFELKDAMDCDYVSRELGYENCECFPMPHQSAFNLNSYDGSSLFYCDLCMFCRDCFGCVALKHKQYCILNKQYSKEDYETLVPKIIEHMRKDGGGAPNQSLRSGSRQAMNRTSPSTPLRVNGASSGSWGEFFPVALSPFAYNETVAQDEFTLTKEEVLERGWRWREEKDDMPKVSKVIAAESLPESIDDIPDDILNWAIRCALTKRPFKIIKQELDFYRRLRLPVPHYHPDERHKMRMAFRNTRRLHRRSCAKCGKGIETTYSPERREVVVCEECYLKEVY